MSDNTAKHKLPQDHALLVGDLVELKPYPGERLLVVETNVNELRGLIAVGYAAGGRAYERTFAASQLRFLERPKP